MNIFENKLLPIKTEPIKSPLKSGDVLVLFGELFQKGYANGLVEEAESLGMKIIKGTVGRRDKGILRPLNSDEISQTSGVLINIPLEAGFDLEPSDSHPDKASPVDQLKDIKLSEWQNARLDWKAIEESKKNGLSRFKKSLEDYFTELEKHIEPGKNVVFAHLMAGGVPRAKIIMPLMNRVFKGLGDRYLDSETFWQSEIGRLCQLSFQEVTANTLDHLINFSTSLKNKIEKSGGHVSYLAYGYHGTEITIDQKFQWQTYTPYLQGWAKIELEKIAFDHKQKGYHCCVYNCPEILTNSSSIFQGVEVSLYPLLFALENTSSPRAKTIISECQNMLKKEHSISEIKNLINEFYNDELIKEKCQFQNWPQHSTKNQLERMLLFSDKLVEMHSDPKNLITFKLSEVVFDACGKIMLHDSWAPKNSSAWIGHDIISKITK